MIFEKKKKHSILLSCLKPVRIYNFISGVHIPVADCDELNEHRGCDTGVNDTKTDN